MLREMADLGFDHVELSHGIRITLVPGILRAVEEGFIKVTSTHNFCPLPTGVLQAAPNLFEPSAPDPRELAQWTRQTKRSLEFASQVGARVLVCHLGSVRFFWFHPTQKLRRFLTRHPKIILATDAKYRRLLTRCLATLRGRMGPFWARTKTSIASVVEYAVSKNVRLGFENREKFEELPLDADFAELFPEVPASTGGGYWHDTGHAEIKHSLGLLDHRAHLEKNAPNLIGFHLHDVDAGGHDHQPIGSGRIDFKMVSSFWQPHHHLVLELSPRIAVADVIRSREVVESLR